MKVSKSIVWVLALAVIFAAVPAANAAEQFFGADLRLDDGGSRSQLTMENVEVLRVDRGSGFYFGDVAGIGVPFIIRSNGADRMTVTVATTSILNNLVVAGTTAIGGDTTVTGTTTTNVLEITGGADLSEAFDVSAKDVQPGMVVSIDPENPGKLRIASEPYDMTVAGIVSGANGVNSGMVMGQKGSIADGAHPVALSGRVYCLADASGAAIVPGDLLTTSSTPGHAMKVLDSSQASGAIIGKAMTPLAHGEKGLVLVLVSLH